MAQITFHDNPVHTSGDLPAVGQTAPAFSLTAADLSDKTLADFAGKRKVLNIFPSVDTGVCAQSVRTFNQRASSLDNVVNLSTFRSSFAADYGVALTDSPLRGLTARAVVVLDENNKVLYSELVAEIANEPDYDAALAVL